MVKKILFFFGTVFITSFSHAQSRVSNSDVFNFWKTFDLVKAAKDSVVVKRQYLQKASGALQELLRLDTMTASDYVQRITGSRKRYDRVREKTLQLSKDDPAINRLFNKYKSIYPGFRQPTVAFVIGTFNRGGTTTRKYILIGAEVMAWISCQSR